MIREQILTKAFDLFIQYGVKKVSMSEIAQTANISKRTLYQLFEDKETLLANGLESQFNYFHLLWEDIEKGPYTVLENILLFFREVMNRPKWVTYRFYEELESYPKAAEMIQVQSRKFEDKCAKILQKGVEEGVFETDQNYGIVVKLARKHMKLNYPSSSFSEYSNSEVYNTVLLAFLRGISTDRGRQILDRWTLSRRNNYVH